MENSSSSNSNSNGSGNVADVRAASVAWLKRATSLPRMKDGRRPAVNGGEKPSASDGDRPPDAKSSTGTVTPALEDPATPQPSTPMYDPADEDEEAGNLEEYPARTPTPPQLVLVLDEQQSPQQPAEASEPVPSRGRRRSRPNSRNHSRANTPRLEAQLLASAAEINQIPSCLSSLSPTTLPARALPPNSATPHLTAGATAALNLNLRAPPPPPFLSPVSPFLPTTTPPPSLEVLQGNYMAGIFRSKSLGRAHALAKLTGGNVTPESEYFTPFIKPTPPAATVPSRSNTVGGGERSAARLVMMQKLRTRVNNNTDTEAQSGAEEVFTAPAILEREREKKKRRRRSHRRSGSTSTNTNQTNDERDFSSAQTTPATAISPLPPQPTPPPPLHQLSDADVQRQEERQRTYYQYQRGGPFVEDENEPPTPRDEEEPVHPILAPHVSPSLTQETAPERSTDGAEQQNLSSGASWQSSAETEVGETASAVSARVPVVMESGRSPYGRQVRQAFPVTAYDAAARDPSDPSEQASDDFDGAPLVPPPRAPWNGQSSASWVVDSPRTRCFLSLEQLFINVPTVLKSRAPGLLEEPELDHDSIASGPSDAEVEPEEAEHCDEASEEAGDEAGEDEGLSPPPVPPKDSYSPATWNHPLPEPANDLPRLEARNLQPATTPPIETPTTSVLPQSTTDDQRLSDISASDDRDSTNPSSGARNDELEDVKGGKSEKMSTWNRVKHSVSHVRRRSRSNSVQRSSAGSVNLSYKDRPTTPMHTHQPSTSLLQLPLNASASVMSLGQVASPQRGISPIPPASAADLARLADPKLNPFPGLQQLHEQRQLQRKMSVIGNSPLAGGFAAAGTTDGSTPTTPLTPGYFSSMPAPSGSRRHSREDDRGAEVVMIQGKASQSGLHLPQALQTQPSTPFHQYQQPQPQQLTDRALPLPHDDSFDEVPLSRAPSFNAHRSKPIEGVKKWLKGFSGPNTPAGSTVNLIATANHSTATQEVKKKASIVDPLPAISRKPSLVEKEGHANGHMPTNGNGIGNGNGVQAQTLKSAPSRQSLKNRAFGLFASADAPKESAVSAPPSSALSPISPTDTDFGRGKPAVDYDTTVDTDRTITKKLVAEKREQAKLAATKEPIPSTLPPQSALPIAPRSPTPSRSMQNGHDVDSADLSSSSIESVISNAAAVGSQTTNGGAPRSAVLTQTRSPPPSAQSVPVRAQSPSILKYRPQSPPINTLANLYSAGSRPQSPNIPRSHSPFRSPTYGSTFAQQQQQSTLQKSTPTTPAFFKQALNSAEILQRVDNILQRDREAKDANKDAKAKERGLADDPPRKLLLVSPVIQVVNKEVAKNRVLFLFSDLMLVAKSVGSSESGRMMDKLFVVKNILDLKRCSAPNLAAGLTSPVAFGDVKRSSMLNTFVREFKVDPDRAIQELMQQTGVGANDSAIIGHLLFKIHELDRTQLGVFLSRRSSRAILHAYIDKFGFSDVRIDYALRIFFLSFYLSDQAEHQALENMLASFASRWFAANVSTVAFDKERCHHLVYAIVLLNASLHLGHLHQGLPATLADFVGMVRSTDQRYTIKEELLEDIYEAIRQERLLGPKDFPGHRGLEVQVTGSISPMHFTFRIKSELIRVRIPQPDANFRVHLLGQGLLFDPPTLHFSKSNEATFRVTGTAIGTKSIVYWRGGANAHIYSMPLATSIAVERKHMRNTIQIGFSPLDATEKEAKQYVFSIEDTREHEHWLKVLRTQIDRAAANALDTEQPVTGGGHTSAVVGVSPRIWKAAEMVAAEVLRETLMGSETSSVCSCSAPH